MAMYKTTDAAFGQGLFLSINLNKQLLPCSFEYMLDNLLGTKIDISVFDKKYKNDKTAASAIPLRPPVKTNNLRLAQRLQKLPENMGIEPG